MNSRLWDLGTAFDPGMFRGLSVFIVVVFALASAVIAGLHYAGKLSPKKSTELKQRMYSWAFIIALIGLPLACGPIPTIIGTTLLSLLCFGEYARAVGLHRHKTMTALVVLGISLVGFAAADAYYNWFFALSIQTVLVIAAVAILRDQPRGYTQRVGLAVFGFMFFGFGLGHLSYVANDAHYREVLLFLILVIELNDVFAYVTGHMFGRHKLAPNTSPGKTREGAIGAMACTTILVMALGPYVFEHTTMVSGWTYFRLGLWLSFSGQMGDLMLSSIKRDIGVKDLGAVIPGHGGFLDRFDSLVMAGPVAFHFLNLHAGIDVFQVSHYFLTW